MRSLALFAIGFLTLPLLSAQDLPNVVFIMADDMGYGDPHSLNPSSKIATPHLDRLAKEGMTFTDAHSPSAVCTPTRYAVITGRYCWRSRLKRGVLNGYGKPLIDPNRLTVGDVFKQSRYHTAAIGKWHLGLGFAKQGEAFDYTQAIEDGPNELGFDHFYGIPASLDFPPYIFIENDRPTAMPSLKQAGLSFPTYLRPGERAPNLVMEEALDHLTKRATDYIHWRAKAKTPFFLYFPLTSPHKPVIPHRRFAGKSGIGPYGDFVMQTDWTVGEVLRALDEAKIAENTLVIFTSDNGSFMHRLDDPNLPGHSQDPKEQAYQSTVHRANNDLRGTKADVWEGGHRVPFFARWPEVIQSSSTCKETICHVDLMATCADLLDHELPEDAAEDSFSWLPLFKGNAWPTPRAPVINHSASGMFAIRMGPWKLVHGNGSGGRENPRGKPDEGPFQLYQLDNDPMEQTDLASKHPDKVTEMTVKLMALRTSGRSR